MHTQKEIAAWLAGRLPDDWFVEAPTVEVDRDEILVVGMLPQPSLSEESDGADRAGADLSRIEAWREETRRARMEIARQAERALRRTVSWGATCGDQRVLFTTVSAPAMTRLRLPERQVLDTLIAAGVARSRSDALAWCVRLVAEKQDDWLADLREAIEKVHEVRGKGPRL